MDKVTRQCPQTTTFLKRKESRNGFEPRSYAYEPNALPLGPNRLSEQQRKMMIMRGFMSSDVGLTYYSNKPKLLFINHVCSRRTRPRRQPQPESTTGQHWDPGQRQLQRRWGRKPGPVQLFRPQQEPGLRLLPQVHFQPRGLRQRRRGRERWTRQWTGSWRQSQAASHGFHQRTAAGVGEGVPQQEVPVADRALPDRPLPAAVRGAGEDLVPEPQGQVEAGQGRAGAREVRPDFRFRVERGAEQAQDRGSHTGPCQSYRHPQPASADGEDAPPSVELCTTGVSLKQKNKKT